MSDPAISDVTHLTRSAIDLAATAGEPADAISDAPAPPAAGHHYHIGAEIARGGMGAVYRATDAVFGREVAVKVLHDKYAPTSAAARRFHDEARITGQLQHPGVPPVFDLGELPGGRPFLAMKLIKGDTLDDLLKGAADRGRLVAVFEKVCEAVAYAHAHGVIHRDLKPANVMVGSYGEVQVMDWGLAKVLAGPDGGRAAADPEATSTGTVVQSLRESDGSFTQAGAVLGTPAYMPPEQALGAVDELDARSDVFGLGGLLAVVLTGKPPFVGDTAETTRMLAAKGKVADCFARLDACGADPDLVALAKRCLAPEKDDRPADAGAVAQAVATLRAAADDRARRAELDRVKAEGEAAAAEQRAAEQRKRRRVQAALGLTFTALVVAGGAFAWHQDRQAAAERGRLGRNAEAVAALLDRAAEALTAGNAAGAGAFLDAADARAAEGGAGDHAARTRRLRADLTALRTLDDVDQYRWTPVDTFPPGPKAVSARYAAALTATGANPDVVDPETAAARVAGSDVRDRLVDALDGMLVADRSSRVRAALRAADPDPFRDAVRDALAAGDAARTAGLAKRLTGPDGGAGQPPGFVATLGQVAEIPVTLRREFLRRAVQDRAGNLALLMALGSTFPLDTRVQAEDRIRWYQGAIAAAPGSAATHITLGRALGDVGDYDGAVAHHRTAVALAPENVAAHMGLGLSLRNKKDWPGAVAAWGEWVRLDPKNPWAHGNHGVALWQTREHDRAVAAYVAAIRLAPQLTRLREELGQKLRTLEQRPREARPWEVIPPPNDPDAHAALGAVHWALRDFPRAVTAYEAAVRLAPESGRLREELGALYLDTGNPDKAALMYEKGLELSKSVLGPGHPDVLRIMKDLGAAYSAAGAGEKASDTLTAFVNGMRNELSHHPPQFALLLAQVSLELLRCDQFATAEALLGECLAIRKNAELDAWSTFNTRSMLGGALLGQKKYAAAEPLLVSGFEGMRQREKAIPPLGRNRLPEALDRLIDLYTAKNEPAEVAKYKELRAKYREVLPAPRRQ
jgi:tetratricopeptide (TPR) repeat protein